ncbi:MAG: dihydrodipicolinate synthase family protein [Thermotogae bacterium]|nr:dihydrodipicolinate synthase family protein [Thermotogota bacterium]
MLTREKVEGVYALVPTPYDEHGRLDEKVFVENIRKLVRAGVHGIATTGTVGEFNTLSFEDFKRLVNLLSEEARKSSTPFVTIVGCSGVNTREVIEKTHYAMEHGIDAVMNVLPFYQRLLEHEIVTFWGEVANACPNIGIFIYNNPITGRVLHDAVIFKKLSDYPNILGSKEVVPDFLHWKNLVWNSPLVHLHIDVMLVPTMMWGARGCFSAVACVKPELILKAYECAKKGMWEKAKKLQKLIDILMACHDDHSYPVTPGGSPAVYKAFVEAGGFLKCGDPGKPYLPVPEEIKKEIRRKLRKVLTMVEKGLSEV